MKGSKATASDSCRKRGAAFLVEVTPDPEVARCNPGENAGQCIEISYRRASHQREHSAEQSARRLPPECVYRGQATYSFRNTHGSGNRDWAAEVVKHEGELAKIQRFDRRRHRPRGSLEANLGNGLPIVTASSRRI